MGNNIFTFRPHRSDDDAADCYRHSSVICLCVCLLITFLSPVKTAKLTEMPFGDWLEWKYVIYGGRNLPREGANLGIARPIEKQYMSVLRRFTQQKINNGDIGTASVLRTGRSHITLYSSVKNPRPPAMRPFVKNSKFFEHLFLKCCHSCG